MAEVVGGRTRPIRSESLHLEKAQRERESVVYTDQRGRAFTQLRPATQRPPSVSSICAGMATAKTRRGRRSVFGHVDAQAIQACGGRLSARIVDAYIPGNSRRGIVGHSRLSRGVSCGTLLQLFQAVLDRREHDSNGTGGSNPSRSASLSVSNILRWLPSPQKSPITTGFARKPTDCDAPAEPPNSFSPVVFLQSSGLRGFSTELVSC
jgi:hypothetical protein